MTEEPARKDGGRAAHMDSAVPNVARMWDYYLGGNDNTDADRDAARLVLGAAPDVPLAALENREFLKHAMRFLTHDARIRQFIDIGPGLPTQGNVHQLVRQHTPDARVVYVDNDPVVLERGRIHLLGVPSVALINGDLREPEAIIEDAELRSLIDLGKPVALCLTLVLHFLTDADNPYQIVSRLSEALPPGSHLVVSHVTGDARDEETLDRITGTYNTASAPLIPRSRNEILKFFDGFELVEPGLVYLSQWRPTTSYYAGGGTHWAYAGVGRK